MNSIVFYFEIFFEVSFSYEAFYCALKFSTWKIPVWPEQLSKAGRFLVGVNWTRYTRTGDRDSTVGSEHLIDHCAYAGEMHFVHWNTTKCKTIDVAPLHEDGLAVIGVFFKVNQIHEHNVKYGSE